MINSFDQVNPTDARPDTRTCEPTNALDRPIAITFFKGYAADKKHEEQCTLRALAEPIRTVTAARKDKLPWLKLARFGELRTDKASLRHDANVTAISGIEADYDGGLMTVDEACDLLTKQGVAALVYSSPSHSEDIPRWRVLCPLSEEMAPDRREKLVGRLNGLFRGIFSSESFTLSQSFYYGSVNRNPSHRVELIDGLPIDLHDDLDETWIGRPDTAKSVNGHALQSGPVDVHALMQEIIAGTSYHSPCVRLAGYFARNEVPYMEARQQLIDAMERVPPASRDARWQKRRADIDRVVEDIFGKEARKRDAHEIPFGMFHQRGENADAASDKRQRGEKPRGKEPSDEPSFFDPWDEPPPPEFPSGVLAPKTEDTLFALARQSGICPGMLCMAHLAAASGAASKASRFQPYRSDDNWTVPPILWLLMIAESGQRKTAAQDLAFAPLRSFDADTWRGYHMRLREWQSLPPKERRNTNPPDEPTPIIAEDITVEKLQLFLAGTNRGMLYLKDEIAGLLEFGRYTNGQGSAERAFLLQAYEGRHYTPSRIGRIAPPIRVNAVTIYGNIQPERLKDFRGLEKDGFIQRMGIVRAGPAAASRLDVIAKGHNTISDLITALAIALPAQFTTTADGDALIRQTEAAGGRFAMLREFGDGFVGWCHKMHGTHARYALVLHLLDGTDRPIIPTATVERAGILVYEYLLPQARDFFGLLPGAAIQRTRDIAGWILASAPNRILVSDIKASVRSCRGLSSREMNDAVDPLVTGAWLQPETDFPSNRTWFVHPSLRQHFAERAQAERDRRAELRRIIQCSATIGMERASIRMKSATTLDGMIVVAD